MNIFRISTALLLAGLFVAGLAAQNFPDANVKTLDRREVALYDYIGQGKNTVVAVWATTCPNCIMELDHMKDYVDKWSEKYNAEVIAVSMDQYQRIRRVKPMVNGRQWPYTVLIDSQRQLGSLLNFTAIPQLFVVDGQGKIIQQYSSYQRGREKEVDRVLARLK